MQPPEPAIALLRATDLAVWLLRKTEKFPRTHRYSLGDRLNSRALDLAESLTAASFASDKTPHLLQAQAAVNSLRILLRIAHQLELLGAGSQQFAAEALDEIGRMAGGWRKSAQRRNPPPATTPTP